MLLLLISSKPLATGYIHEMWKVRKQSHLLPLSPEFNNEFQVQLLFNYN